MPKFSLKRKFVGFVVVVFALAFFAVVMAFTVEVNELNSFLHKDCTLPENICPFNQVVPSNSILGFTADALLFAFGAYLLLKKEDTATSRNGLKKFSTAKKTRINMDKLEPDERKLVSLVHEAGAMFQSELVEKTGFGKVKVTRILDRLEAKGILERKRRGMTNVVVFRQ